MFSLYKTHEQDELMENLPKRILGEVLEEISEGSSREIPLKIPGGISEEAEGRVSERNLGRFEDRIPGGIQEEFL